MEYKTPQELIKEVMIKRKIESLNQSARKGKEELRKFMEKKLSKYNF